MRKVIENICVLMLTTLVLFLSVGMHISKMNCSKDNRFFLGTTVPNCMQESEMSCVVDFQKTSCCQKNEIEQSCCPQTNDNSCASETTNIQFDFETLIPVFSPNFEFLSVFLRVLFDKGFYYTNDIYYVSSIPPPKINKPLLMDIQSFLL